MRVKLCYTVNEEDVLRESAKILQLSADDMQQAVNLFNAVQSELKGEDPREAAVPNTLRALEMIEEFRQALLNLDTRLSEVVLIVEGYDEYVRTKAHAAAGGRPVQGEEPPALELT